MPHVPTPLSQWKDAGKKSCVDCTYSTCVYADFGDPTSPTPQPVSYWYYCSYPNDELFKHEVNQRARLATTFHVRSGSQIQSLLLAKGIEFLSTHPEITTQRKLSLRHPLRRVACVSV